MGVKKDTAVEIENNLKNPKLCFSEQFDSLTKARRIESKIKLLKRKDYIEKIILDGYIKLT
jgi:predicted GIY-YIG superfamily endonuclease